MSSFLNGLARFRRGPWEAFASTLIAVGVVMLMQPWVHQTVNFLKFLSINR